jgi:SecD/SecF fusion protein
MHARPAQPLPARRCLAAGLAIVGLSLAACGGAKDEGAAAAGPSCDRAAAAFSQPTRRLTFHVDHVSPRQLDETQRILCVRLSGSGVDHRVRVASGDVVVELPSSSLPGREGARSPIFGAGRLAFYDWEVDVVGPGGRLAPRDPAVTGGASAGVAGSISHHAAMVRSSKRPHTVVVRAERATDVDVRAGWYVLRDDVALTGDAIVRPEQRIDGPGAGPVVTFEFTAAGRPAWQRLTREIADRGRRVADSGRPAADADQHFAIVVDDRIVSVPYVDFHRNPQGIDGRAGSQIQGGFTIASARQLAALLRSGPLPVALTPAG